MTALKTRSEGRQSPLVARAAFDFSDLPSTDFVAALELPADAIITGGSLSITTADVALSTISVGSAAAPTSLLGATAADAIAVTPIPAGADLLGEVTDIGLTCSVGMTLISGSLVVEYVRSGRVHSTQG